MLKHCIITAMILICDCQDIFFPNNEETSHLSGNGATITERIPIYVPKQCPENMLLYPGGGIKSTWICDCRPRFLYFPLNDSCHEAYRQGLCNNGEYVMLPLGEEIPKCVINPCHEDGLVRYDGICYNLRMRGGPCAPDGVLDVNDITFQVQCTPIKIVPFSIIDAPSITTATPCPAGSRRNSLGICKVPI